MTGFHNHYDDPDEFWDDEPIVRRKTGPFEPAPAGPPSASLPSAWNSTGVPGIEFELDRGLLPIRISAPSAWSPSECADQLFRAYRHAVTPKLAVSVTHRPGDARFDFDLTAGCRIAAPSSLSSSPRRTGPPTRSGWRC